MDNKYHNPNEHWYYKHKRINSGESYKICLYCLIGIVILFILSFLFTGCKSIEYVPVETVRTEYVTKTDTFMQKDSVVFHDSVYIHSEGDTVWYEKWHTKYKERIVAKIVIDSFIKTDSIPVPYPVEKKLTKWQRIKVDAGGYSLGLCLVLMIMLVVSLVLKIKKG